MQLLTPLRGLMDTVLMHKSKNAINFLLVLSKMAVYDCVLLNSLGFKLRFGTANIQHLVKQVLVKLVVLYPAENIALGTVID